MAEDLISAQRYGDARGVTVAAQGDQEDGSLLVLEGRAWLQERDLVRAQAALLRAVRASPDLAEAYRWLGQVLLKRGDPQRALKTLRRALELDPTDDEAQKLAVRAEHLSEAIENDSSPLIEEPVSESKSQPTAASRARSVSAAGAKLTPPGASRAPANEPTSSFRQIPGRPDNRAAARGGSGSMPSVKSAIPNPPEDPELGRYSAQNITAEQMVLPRPTPPQPTRPRKPTPARQALPRPPQPSGPVTPRGPRATGSPSQSLEPRRSPSLPSVQRPNAATREPSLPPLPDARSGAPGSGRAQPTAARAAASQQHTLETWDESQGVALEPPSQPLAAAAKPSAGALAAALTDADAAFAVVQRYGLFEEPRGAAAQWASESEIEPRGTKVRNALIGLWVVTLLISVGGYFGWQAFVAERHAKAAAWVQDARALMKRGDHAGLVDAERLLRLAREQHPASTDIPLENLILQVERVMEDGERDLAALKLALGRAPVSTEGKASQDVATAVVSAFGGDKVTRDKLLDQALASASSDPRRMHLLGRLEERLGRPQAREHIEAASQADPKLVPAKLALAQIALDAGERADALARVDAVLGDHKEHLRARLLRMFITANDAEPAQLEAALNGLTDAMKLAGSVDEVLFSLTKARVLRREGKLDEAGAAIERAAALGVDEPRLLAWVAREALAMNKPALAQTTASRALSVAPDVAPYRRLLARVLIERGDGARARELLDKLPVEDLEAQIMKARAALLEDDPPVLQAALAGLNQAPSDKPDSAVEVGALKIRLESKLTPGKGVVDRAKALVKSAPGDPEALLALAEAGLAAHDPATASGALKQRFAVAPDDPNAHYLLGRARRMAADADGAEASFRKALTLSPGQSDALIALGGLLLDEGKYDEADVVFQELSNRGGSAMAGRLGRIDALVALGKTADAQVQLDAIPDAQRGSAAVKSAAARVALARGKPGEALSLLRPVLETQGDRASFQALYGDALLAAEQVESADEAYDKALKLDAGLPEALLGRAQVQLRTNKAKDALPTLESAKRALSDRIRPPALHGLRAMLVGQAYLLRNKRGDVETAKSALRDALKLSAVPPEAHFWLGEALGAKAAGEAKAEYRRYLELAPNGKYADRARRAMGSLS